MSTSCQFYVPCCTILLSAVWYMWLCTHLRRGHPSQCAPWQISHNKVYLILLSWGIIVQTMYYLKTKREQRRCHLRLQHLKCMTLFQIHKAIINRVCRHKQPLTIIIPRRTFVSAQWRPWHSFVELLSPLILLEASRRNKYLHSRHLHFPRTLPLTDCRRESF